MMVSSKWMDYDQVLNILKRINMQESHRKSSLVDPSKRDSLCFSSHGRSTLLHAFTKPKTKQKAAKRLIHT